MAKLSIRPINSDRGQGISLTDLESNRTQIFFVQDALPPAVRETATSLFAGAGLLTRVITDAVATLLPEVVGPHVMRAVPGVLASRYSDFVNAVGASARDNKKAIAAIADVPPSTVATAAIRQRAVVLFDAAPNIAEKIRLPSNVFTLPQLQGLVEVDALSILPDDAQSAIMDRYMKLSYASKYGIASKYPATATPDSPIPSGIDQAAVDAEAEKFVGAIRDHAKQLENCSQIARDLIAFVALACSCTVGTAFGLLTNKT